MGCCFTNDAGELYQPLLDQAMEQAKKEGTIIENGCYIHKITQQEINCPLMMPLQSKDPLECKIYNNMRIRNEYNPKNLNHMQQYRHYANEYEDKPVCKYGEECKSYIRSEKGVDQNCIEDKCHMIIFRHPPRTRQIKLAENIHSLVINKSSYKNHGLYKPTIQEQQKYGLKNIKKIEDYDDDWINWKNPIDGLLEALIDEVYSNNFGYDLCLSCSKDDECKHNVYDSKYSILHIVHEKMNCLRHKMMQSPLDRGMMLALILYTGCDCNYDLCAHQRNGDYYKWRWLDYCLYNAIWKLSGAESGRYPVYSGLNGVKMDKKVVTDGFFVTYVSTSWKKQVSEAFMKGQGMMLHIDAQFRYTGFVICCDVSWISKFPDECEILFARALDSGIDKFSCTVLDESNGVQTVSLKHNSGPLCSDLRLY